MPDKSTAIGVFKDPPQISNFLGLIPERPGYSRYTCTTGRQQGHSVLRADYIEMGELRRLARWQKAWTQAIEDDDEGKLNQVYADLARLVPAWDFVDRSGGPLPSPEQDSTVFDRLDTETMTWILGNGEGQLLADLFPKAS